MPAPKSPDPREYRGYLYLTQSEYHRVVAAAGTQKLAEFMRQRLLADLCIPEENDLHRLQQPNIQVYDDAG